MTDHIQKLKEFKAPWWAVALGRWRAWHRRKRASRQWTHVAVVTAWAFNKRINRQVNAWFHLYERGNGKRTFTFERESNYLFPYHSTLVYNQIVRPWLDGYYSNTYVRDFAKKSCKAP